MASKKEANHTDKKTAEKKNPKKGTVATKAQRGNPLQSGRRFLEGVWQELRKVHWPTRREVIIYTGVVLVAVVFIGVVLMVADLILSQIMTRVIP